MVETIRSYKTISSPITSTKIVAAIPCYNTQRTIASVISRTQRYVDEVLVVDDGSTDMTAEIAEAAGARVIRHHINKGKGAAMKTALSHVDADIVVFIDGDGQHDPGDIPRLIEPIVHGKVDFVIGSRYLSESRTTSNPFNRKAANTAASFTISFIISVMQPLVRFVSRQQLDDRLHLQMPGIVKSSARTKNYRLLDGKFKWISDCTSGFTAMRIENYSKINLISNGFQIETEMIFEQAKNGLVIAETPISCKWGESTSKLSIAKDGLITLALLAKKLLNISKSKTAPRAETLIQKRI